MKRMLIIGAAIFALGIVSGTASAQIRPVPVIGMACITTQYDLDGDGLLTKADISVWLEQLMAAQCMDQAADGACARFDDNGDRMITVDDVLIRVNYFRQCVVSTHIPTRPR